MNWISSHNDFTIFGHRSRQEQQLVAAQKQTTSWEILLWMTPSEAPKALQASECSELLDPARANCWISAQHQPGKFTRSSGQYMVSKMFVNKELLLIRTIQILLSPTSGEPEHLRTLDIWEMKGAQSQHCSVRACGWCTFAIADGKIECRHESIDHTLGRSPHKNCKNDLDGQTWQELE